MTLSQFFSKLKEFAGVLAATGVLLVNSGAQAQDYNDYKTCTTAPGLPQCRNNIHIHINRTIDDCDCDLNTDYDFWVQDPTLSTSSGKRGWIAYSKWEAHASFGGDGPCCRNRTSLDDMDGKTGRTVRKFCPLDSKWKTRPNYADPCLSYANQINDCEQGRGPGCGSEPFCDPLMACPNYFTLQDQYNTCLITAYGQQSTFDYYNGFDDCFCADDFSTFKQVDGKWSCISCDKTKGFMQNKKTGVGCVSICDEQSGYAYNETDSSGKMTFPAGYNPALEAVGTMDSTFPNQFNGSCVKCPADKPVIGCGRCRALPAPNEKWDEATCNYVKLCPDGMNPQLNPDGTLNKCSCTSQTGFPRTAVIRATTAGVEGWRVATTSESATNSARCACSDVPSSTTSASFNDSADVIAVAAPGNYGPVALGTTGYQCGCPNFNEIPQLVGGAYQCVPQVKGAGAQLVAYDASKTPAQNGVLTALPSQLTNLTVATLRSSAGTTGVDLSTPYQRRVWTCREGFTYNTGTKTCDPVQSNFAVQNCGTGGIVSSADTNSTVAAAGIDFTKLVSPRLACCLSDSNITPLVGSKYHCAASAPAPNQTFLEYYNAGAAPSDDTAGLTYPNRLWLTDSNGSPTVGIFRKDGTQCNVWGTATKAQILGDLATISANRNNPNPFAGTNAAAAMANQANRNECQFVVMAALQVTCDPTRTATTAGGVARCPVAAEVSVHYNVFDLGDPTAGTRTAFRYLSSIDPKGGVRSGASSSPIRVQDLLPPR